MVRWFPGIAALTDSRKVALKPAKASLLFLCSTKTKRKKERGPTNKKETFYCPSVGNNFTFYDDKILHYLISSSTSEKWKKQIYILYFAAKPFKDSTMVNNLLSMYKIGQIYKYRFQ